MYIQQPMIEHKTKFYKGNVFLSPRCLAALSADRRGMLPWQMGAAYNGHRKTLIAHADDYLKGDCTTSAPAIHRGCCADCTAVTGAMSAQGDHLNALPNPAYLYPSCLLHQDDVPNWGVNLDFVFNGTSVSKWIEAFTAAVPVYVQYVNHMYYFLEYFRHVSYGDQAKAWLHNSDINIDGITCSLSAQFGPYSQNKMQTIHTKLRNMSWAIRSPTYLRPIRWANDYWTIPYFADNPERLAKMAICDGIWGSTHNEGVNGKVIYLCGKWHQLPLISRWTNIFHELLHAAGGVGHLCAAECSSSGEKCGAEWRCAGKAANNQLKAANRYDIVLSNVYAWDTFMSGFRRAVAAGRCYPSWWTSV